MTGSADELPDRTIGQMSVGPGRLPSRWVVSATHIPKV